MDRLVDQLKSQLVPLFKEQKGYLGTISNVNRETGVGATTTYWDSMESLKASEAAIFAARDRFLAEQNAETLSVHRCEVAVMERRGEPRAGRHVRITSMKRMDLDEGINRFKETVAPLALSQPGCAAAVLLVDRENSQTYGITAWDTKEQRDASEAVLGPHRDEVAARLGIQAMTDVAETMFAELPTTTAV